jgi:hypothetical protein
MKEKLLETVRKSMGYTLSVAESMPEKFYTSRPTEANWNFAEVLSHIAYGITWWQETMIEIKKTEWAPPPAKTSKKEVIAQLKETFERYRVQSLR